ncbi:claudin-8-like [Electrophorus electricus]|uniref:claudin-8-like n=1 Tax=Electrophorus electricus TaxID=8005 RepID=UPI0015D01A56|nr:claudin-8-like [Electrophorus electricus]
MVNACEIIALCLGAIGLVGTAATTGLPMWRVTAFIQENIIVMETRWEGLWMNCFRQANIRMQCKVYDSLLYLPPEMQASRGLMCCSVALSFLGVLAALLGLRNTSCLQDQNRLKALLIVIAGVMQIMAAICVFIPVSWTAHVIIQDFYNPLLLDAQRRELGEALYIGWVTGAFLFLSGVVFLCCRSTLNSDRLYQPVYGTASSTLSRFHPLTYTHSSVSTLPQQPHLYGHGLAPKQTFHTAFRPAVPPAGGQPTFNEAQLTPDVLLLNHANMVPAYHRQGSMHSSHDTWRHSTPRNSAKPSLLPAPVRAGHDGPTHNLPTDVQTSQKLFAPSGYGNSWIKPHRTLSPSNSGMYI